MFVWNAIPSITPMMSLILRELWLISSIVVTTCETTVPPRAATSAAVAASWFAWRAESALWRTVPVSCSMLAAVSCRLLAVCSVRELRSWLPVAISCDAVLMLSAAVRSWRIMSRKRWRMASTSVTRVPSSSRRVVWNACVRSPWDTVVTALVSSRSGALTLRRISANSPPPSSSVVSTSRPQNKYIMRQCVAMASSSDTSAMTHQPLALVSRLTAQGRVICGLNRALAWRTKTSWPARISSIMGPASGFTSSTFLPASAGGEMNKASALVARGSTITVPPDWK